MGRGLRRNIYNVGVNGSRQLLKILPDKGMQVRPSGANKEKEGIFDGSQRIDESLRHTLSSWSWWGSILSGGSRTQRIIM